MNNQEKYMSRNPDLLDGPFIDGASVVKKAVGKILIDGGRVSGTGFRISQNLIMTCQHLGNIVQDDVIHFNYVDHPWPGTPASTLTQTATETFTLRPDIFFYESPALDFAVVAISDANRNLRGPRNMETISSVRLVKEKKQLGKLQINIISYPEGKPLKMSVRKKTVVEDPSRKILVGKERRPVKEETILHQADTEVGSSGAPIFDERWRLVGIHQGYENVVAQSKENAIELTEDVFDANYGTLMKHILDEMFSKPGEEPTVFERKFNACEMDLGIPFREYPNKLKDFAGPAAANKHDDGIRPIPESSISSQSREQDGPNLSPDTHTNGGSGKRPSHPRPQKHVLVLAESWSWLKGNELSFITKRVAMEFAKSGAEVRVSCLVTQTTAEEQTQAKEHGVQLFGIKRPRSSSTLFLPPDNLLGANVDIIIGCGLVGGEHGEFVKTQFRGSCWVHLACSYPEHEDENEVQFFENADLSFAIGKNLASEYENRLAYSGKAVRGFTPGVLKDVQMYQQSEEERQVFKVLAFYPSVRELQSGVEDVFSIPAKAISTLSGQYQLLAVCAPEGDPTKLKTFLLQHRFRGSLPIVRRCARSLEMRCRMFSEADLLILPFLPSKTESFGLIGLQAFSAGLPVLLNQRCGLASALQVLPHGDSYVVNSDRPEDWRDRIRIVGEKSRSLRLSEAQTVLQHYDEKYPWERQSREVLEAILQSPQ